MRSRHPPPERLGSARATASSSYGETKRSLTFDSVRSLITATTRRERGNRSEVPARRTSPLLTEGRANPK
ncbi:hypothetical protein EYF80_054307 [Liparis tanakae]|uniref:Uncharacterized protein n=1 Tax=Liparis tanakae TaxID=230148 RepID=A0A4Z2F3R5_9TELE|nr:hypothetical protein EYF80_054307 [Liparis tanakae]